MGLIGSDDGPTVYIDKNGKRVPLELVGYYIEDGRLTSQINDAIHEIERNRQELKREHREEILHKVYGGGEEEIHGNGKEREG